MTEHPVWFELREPGCTPQRKGPFRHDQVKAFLRALLSERPSALVTVITIHEDGPDLQDGPECLEMIDGRHAATAAKHRRTSRAAWRACQ